MSDPYSVVRQFEADLCRYTGAFYAVTTTSCTTALLLACVYHNVRDVRIPKRTYIGVPQSIIHAGGAPVFTDKSWDGWYQLEPYPIWDSARWFTSGMFDKFPSLSGDQMVCVSFHWGKTLGLGQGGAILTNDAHAAELLRRMRFDGRAEGVDIRNDSFPILGYHAYMMPELAAQGVVRLALLPRHNVPIPKGDYPDLSKVALFGGRTA